jgi:uridine monophosphate synthetase
VSRRLSRAADPRQAARELRDQINFERTDAIPVGTDAIYCVCTTGAISVPAGRDRRDAKYCVSTCLADGLLEAGCVKFGKFTLKSGLESPIYLDLRQLVSYPRLLAEAAAAYTVLLRNLTFDRLAALPYAALPIGTAISLQTGWPLVYPRKEAKTYGTKAEIEGLFAPGEVAAVVDDLTTTGVSKFEAIDKLTAAGLQVRDVVVLIDRQSGAAESLAQAGYRLHTVFTLTQLLDHWEATGKVPPEQIVAAREFIAS